MNAFQESFKPSEVILSTCKKWNKDTAVSFGFLNTSTTFLSSVNVPTDNMVGLKCVCINRGLGYAFISSDVFISTLQRLVEVTFSKGPVAIRKWRILVIQFDPVTCKYNKLDSNILQCKAYNRVWL